MNATTMSTAPVIVMDMFIACVAKYAVAPRLVNMMPTTAAMAPAANK